MKNKSLKSMDINYSTHLFLYEDGSLVEFTPSDGHRDSEARYVDAVQALRRLETRRDRCRGSIEDIHRDFAEIESFIALIHSRREEIDAFYQKLPKGYSEPLTIRDIKEKVERSWRFRDQDQSSSPEHAEFWAELNRLGYSLSGKNPEETMDVDADAYLDPVQAAGLLARVPGRKKS